VSLYTFFGVSSPLILDCTMTDDSFGRSHLHPILEDHTHTSLRRSSPPRWCLKEHGQTQSNTSDRFPGQPLHSFVYPSVLLIWRDLFSTPSPLPIPPFLVPCPPRPIWVTHVLCWSFFFSLITVLWDKKKCSSLTFWGGFISLGWGLTVRTKQFYESKMCLFHHLFWGRSHCFLL
jgi:hypothetical protein